MVTTTAPAVPTFTTSLGHQTVANQRTKTGFRDVHQDQESADQMMLHDAKIVSLDLSTPKCAVIGFIEPTGTPLKLVLQELDRLRACDFRQGNIVLDVVITTRCAPRLETLRRLFDLKEGEPTPEYLQSKASKVESGDLTLVHIEPSYGCELMALCKTATLL